MSSHVTRGLKDLRCASCPERIGDIKISLRDVGTGCAGDAGPCRGSQSFLERPVGAKQAQPKLAGVWPGRIVVEASASATCEASALFVELKAGPLPALLLSNASHDLMQDKTSPESREST